MTVPSVVAAISHYGVLATIAYTGTLILYVGVMLCVALWENRFRRKQRDTEDYDALLGSRYTIPVSVIAPVFNEGTIAIAPIRSLLALSYPQFEVIVVDDGSTDDTLAVLIDEFKLVPRQVFFRNYLTAKSVRTVYRSETEPSLIVVSKDNGGKADALNCGTNFARYRYLCCVDGDTVFARDALLSAMSVIAKDPGRILGAASLFGVSLHPEASGAARPNAAKTNDHLLADFQHLDLMRAFVGYRAAWSRLECMMCISGGFGMWRRDVVQEVGGFSPDFTCEDIEMTFRIHELYLREGRPYRIISLPGMVAQTEGPRSVRSLVSQRARWQRVTMETNWHYRGMFGRPRYRAVGLLGMPYYLLFESLAPLFQVLSLLTLVLAAAFGFLGWQAYLLFLGIMIFATAIPTTVAVMFHDAGYRDYRMSALIRMLALGPLDFIAYRPIIIYAGLRGFWEFLRKQKDWNKFERNVRPVAPVASMLLVSLLALASPARTHAQAVRAPSVDSLVTAAIAERRHNDRPSALATMERAATLAPDRSDVGPLYRQLKWEVYGSEASVSGSYEAWDDDRDPWRQVQVAVRQNAPNITGVARVSHATRFGLRDDKIELEAYPRIGSGYAALSAGYSPDAKLYARSSVGAELFGSFLSRMEGSVGYRRLNFVDAVDVVTGSVGMYDRAFLYSARANAVSGGAKGQSLVLSARRYFADGIQFVGARAGAGSIREDVLTQSDLATTSSRTVGMDAMFLVRMRWVIMFSADAGREATRTIGSVNQVSTTLGLGLRF